MNRPKLEDYKSKDSIFEVYDNESYSIDLDEYCDELERINKKLNDKVYMLSGEHFINPFDGCMDCCYKNNDCKSNGSCRKYRGI